MLAAASWEVIYLLYGSTQGQWYTSRVGQHHIYTVYVRHIWQGSHQIYGHIWCIYTVLANPIYKDKATHL
jgi:hypothetical protein